MEEEQSRFTVTTSVASPLSHDVKWSTNSCHFLEYS